jgi:hypothetical protein
MAFSQPIVSKSLRDALFLDQFSDEPSMYIGVAVVIAVVSAYVRLSYRFAQPVCVGDIAVFHEQRLARWWAVRFDG